jgi:hypothetical protein
VDVVGADGLGGGPSGGLDVAGRGPDREEERAGGEGGDTTSRTGIAGTFVGGTLKYAANNSD